MLWIGNSWGGSIARVDTRSGETTFVPLPYQGMGPYQIAVDSKHNAWLNIWTSDVVLKYDPAADKWTTFDLPTRGSVLQSTAAYTQNRKGFWLGYQNFPDAVGHLRVGVHVGDEGQAAPLAWDATPHLLEAVYAGNQRWAAASCICCSQTRGGCCGWVKTRRGCRTKPCLCP